jgi:hypothetical protein
VKSENHELEHILDSVDELLLDTAEFIDELDFDGDTIGTNPPELQAFFWEGYDSSSCPSMCSDQIKC